MRLGRGRNGIQRYLGIQWIRRNEWRRRERCELGRQRGQLVGGLCWRRWRRRFVERRRYFYLFTYWNNEQPPNNFCYVDDLAIATSKNPPPNQDAAGNAYIGSW